eukprot:scaffold1033_cov408-Prasinococcus_capsulatus_cf.AAC.38
MEVSRPLGSPCCQQRHVAQPETLVPSQRPPTEPGVACQPLSLGRQQLPTSLVLLAVLRSSLAECPSCHPPQGCRFRWHPPGRNQQCVPEHSPRAATPAGLGGHDPSPQEWLPCGATLPTQANAPRTAEQPPLQGVAARRPAPGGSRGRLGPSTTNRVAATCGHFEVPTGRGHAHPHPPPRTG